MKIVKKPLQNNQFYSEAQTKSAIVFHHTAGLTAQGAIDWWNQTPEKVGTAYVIDRDGTIYECFSPEKWGYHLGIKKHNGTPFEQHSIGIELVAAGQLKKDKEKFYFLPLAPSTTGAKEIPKEQVWEMPVEWKGNKYYHAYTDAQITALIELTKDLMTKFGIKVQPTFNKFYQFNDDVIVKNMPGIWSHSTVREDGKTDIVPYPAFLKKLSDAFGVKIENLKETEVKVEEPAIAKEDPKKTDTSKGSTTKKA